MNASKVLIACIFCSLFLLTSGTTLPEPAVQDLRGSWALIKYKHGADKELTEVPKVINYVKHLTDRHFTWASYGENGNLVGAGGGTYELSGKSYIEHIHFFHPHGSNLPGTTATFNSHLEGNDWTISGYFHNIQIDPGSGEYKKVDSIAMVEVWRRI